MRRSVTGDWLLALDQGGHSTRALVFDNQGELVEQARVAVETRLPYPGWVEQDAEQLAISLRTVIDEIAQRLGRHISLVRGAGLATQRSNVVCWLRETGEPLSAVLSWQDVRAQLWLEQFTAQRAEIASRTGLPLSAHYGASKLRWCLEHLPTVAQAQRQGRLLCGSLASYLLATLLPERPALVDPVNAARTLLWNLAQRDWDPWLLDLFGVQRTCLPRCVPNRYNFGSVKLGQHSVPVRVLTGDQAAALYGQGALQANRLYVNVGTGAFVQRVFTSLPTDSDRLLRSLVYSDGTRSEYVLEGTVNGAGCALDWARDELGLRDIERALPQWLTRSGDIPLFLNGIAGLGSPWWKGQFASRFLQAGEPWAQAVAVAESIVFMLCENISALTARGPGVTGIMISGGLAQLDGLCQRLADLSRLTVFRSRQLEATARGLAYLVAAADTHNWSSCDDEVFQPQPAPDLSRRYQAWQTAMRQALRDE